MNRKLAAIVAVAAVIALAATVVAVPAHADPIAGPPARLASARLHVPKQHSLLIVGASYTAGWGSTNPRLDYAQRLAADLGWPATVTAEPGAGYISRGDNGHDSFLQQVDSLPATLRTGLVIVQGGRNDSGRPAAQERAAVLATIDAIRARFDDPQIVMLGDIPATLPAGRSVVATNEVLERAAASQHVAFVDPIREHWMTPADVAAFRSPIPGHPNDAGHAYIAHRLAVDLCTLSDGAICGHK